MGFNSGFKGLNTTGFRNTHVTPGPPHPEVTSTEM